MPNTTAKIWDMAADDDRDEASYSFATFKTRKSLLSATLR